MKDDLPYIVSTASLSPEHIARFRNAGLEIHPLRFIETNISISTGNRVRIAELQNNKSTVVFTSAHAVKAIVSMLASTPDWKAACIGGATRQELEWSYPAIPVIAIAMLTFTGIFNIKAINRSSAAVLFVVWLFSLGTMLFYISKVFNDFRSSASCR
ncbi:MAG: hypothetical protein EOP49_36270, partial [Sphingobacteriales bacterium]